MVNESKGMNPKLTCWKPYLTTVCSIRRTVLRVTMEMEMTKGVCGLKTGWLILESASYWSGIKWFNKWEVERLLAALQVKQAGGQWKNSISVWSFPYNAGPGAPQSLSPRNISFLLKTHLNHMWTTSLYPWTNKIQQCCISV